MTGTGALGMAITIKDVAAIAGVSPATVSRVLNGTATVSAAKTKAVHDAIARTGFEVSIAARRLATGQTESIAVVLTEPVDQLFYDPTYTAILRGVMEGLAPSDYSPILISAANTQERKKAVRLLSQKVADAMIHLSPYVDEHLLADPELASIPLVLCGRAGATHAIRPHSTVRSDDSIGAREIGNYLLQRRAERVLPLMGPRNNPATEDRLRGYREALGDRLLPPVVVGDWTQRSGFKVLRDVLSAGATFDAVVAGNDRIARGAIRALEDAGLGVPTDVRVFGFDDHDIAVKSDPTISTVRQPFREQGEAAVSLTLDLIAGGSPRELVLPSELVIRESA